MHTYLANSVPEAEKRLRSLHFRRPPPHSGSGGGAEWWGATPTLNSLAGIPAPLCHTYYNATKEEGKTHTERRGSTSNLDIKFPLFSARKMYAAGEKRKKGKCQIFLM